MSSKQIAIPDLGDAADVEVIEVLVSVGDELNVEDPVLTLESAKASMDVPCPEAGKVLSLNIKVGDKVNSGDPMLELEVAGDATAEANDQDSPNANTDSQPSAAEPAQSAQAIEPTTETVSTNTPPAPAETTPEPTPATEGSTNIYASPAVRRIATEHEVDLNTVTGTGPNGRITKGDIQTHLGLTDAPPKPAAVDRASTSTSLPSSQQGKTHSEPMSRINKLSASHLHQSWSAIPHVTHFDEADITGLEDWRLVLKQQRSEPRLSLLPFVMKAVAHCLQLHPRFNCQLSADGEQLVYRHYFNLGIAVDTPNGLVVPVIKDVDRKGVWELAAELAATAERARNGQLKAADLQDGCFTISNLGGLGGQHFTPIINAPEVAILGLGQARWQLVRQGAVRQADSSIEDRLIQPLAISYDHRVIDGAVAARFIQSLKTHLEDIRHLLL